MFRCFWLAATPKFDESDTGYPSSENDAQPSRGTPIWSYITPREQPSFAGTTTRCTCQSVSRFVVGLRTEVIRLWRSGELQQSVGTIPGGTGTFAWSFTTVRCHPVLANTV